VQETSHRYRAPNRQSNELTLTVPGQASSDTTSVKSDQSGLSLRVRRLLVHDETEGAQDIKEVWFAGQHGDVGGGWKLDPNDAWPLSHIPLVWMVKEAKIAELHFDTTKLKSFECDSESEDLFAENEDKKFSTKEAATDQNHDAVAPKTSFHQALKHAEEKGIVHDCLRFGGGLPSTSTMSWWIMEYLPFRRMDLQPDGSWKPINWPLPYGEVRDIPEDAEIHASVIRRMQLDPSYRPGNLIIGEGGRGVKSAPQQYGTGKWAVWSNEGDPVRETYRRKKEFREIEN
jgi:hypothetical protein